MINRCIVCCLSVLLVYLTGCASSGRRFYSEELRPIKNVAIVYPSNSCVVNSIAEEGKPKKNLKKTCTVALYLNFYPETMFWTSNMLLQEHYPTVLENR
jgi:hypothetical protein